MNFKLELQSDKYEDGLGNCFPLEPDQVNLKSEIAPLKACFSYSNYNEAFHPNESEVNLQSDMENDDVDVTSEQEETCKLKRGHTDTTLKHISKDSGNCLLNRSTLLTRRPKQQTSVCKRLILGKESGFAKSSVNLIVFMTNLKCVAANLSCLVSIHTRGPLLTC